MVGPWRGVHLGVGGFVRPPHLPDGDRRRQCPHARSNIILGLQQIVVGRTKGSLKKSAPSLSKQDKQEVLPIGLMSPNGGDAAEVDLQIKGIWDRARQSENSEK